MSSAINNITDNYRNNYSAYQADYIYTETEAHNSNVPYGNNQHKVSESQDLLEDYGDITYGRKTLQDMKDENQGTLAQWLDSLTICSEMENIISEAEMKRRSEIYCIWIQNGKVHVSGGEGYHHKARAYEKLLNASLGYQFEWKWRGTAQREDTVLKSLDEILHYYMAYDKKLFDADNLDSIVNHVDEAFNSWYQENKPERQMFNKWI